MKRYGDSSTLINGKPSLPTPYRAADGGGTCKLELRDYWVDLKLRIAQWWKRKILRQPQQECQVGDKLDKFELFELMMLDADINANLRREQEAQARDFAATEKKILYSLKK